MRASRIAANAALVAGLSAGLTAGPFGHAASAQDIAVTPVPAAETARVTLYQNGLGIVDEVRLAEIGAAGPSRLSLTGIAPAAVDGSAVIETTGLDVNRLVYRLQPLSQRMMLERAVGGPVERIRVHPESGAESYETVTLLGLDGNAAIVEKAGRVETVDPNAFALGTPGADLLDRPAIGVAGHATAPGARALRLRYLTGGVAWSADYVIDVTDDGPVASAREPDLDITGWASVRNASGRPFTARPLVLVAGDVNRISVPEAFARADEAAPRTMAMAAEAAPAFERTASGDVHVYALAGPVDLAANETTQVRLLKHEGLKAERRYIVEGGGHLFRAPVPGMQPFENPAVELRFANAGSEPLPAGEVRVYTDGRLAGENVIPATPAGETVVLRTGLAFDLTVRRRQTAFRRLGPPDNDIETAHAFELRNAKDTAAVIEIRERIGGEWEMIDSSHPMERDGLMAVWRIEVPASGAATLTYAVRVKR